jgi:predicted metal-dependent hydrolase
MILDYKIRRSKRKTIALNVSSRGELEVVVPNEMDDKQIESVINKKKFWIYKTINKTKEKLSKQLKKEFISGELFWYLGKRYRLDVTNNCEHSGLKFKQNKFILSSDTVHKAELLFREFYRHKAKEKLEPQVLKYAKQMGVEYKEVKIIEMKKRWGSCTNQGNIILNLHLIKAPMYVIDYVIVHELAHLIEYNHSKKFWNIVKTQIPNYKEHMQWLDKFDIEI